MTSPRHVPGPPRARRLVVGVLACAVLGACGGEDDSDDSTATTPTTTTVAVTSSTTARATTTSAATTASTAASSSTTVAQSGAADVWNRTAVEYRGRNGERFTIECPPGGVDSGIWGVETYTDDSSICTAAVHVGLITFEEGGEVEFEIAAGLEEYESRIGHDVLSSRYGRYEGSFFFPEAPPGTGEFTVGPESWGRTASEYQRQTGDRVTQECAAGGPLRSIWGTGTYTSDSSICTAAVHMGLITVAAGGKVTIEIAPGADEYEGTTANGVTSSSFGAYPSGFTFPDDQPGDRSP